MEAQDPAAAEVEEIAKGINTKLEFMESANFTFATAVSRSEMRALIQIAEDAYLRFAKTTGLSGWKDLFGDSRCMIVILPTKSHFKKYAEWYERKYARENFKSVADGARFFCVDTPRSAIAMHLKPADVEKLRFTVCHEVGHLAIMRYHFNNNFVPPWLGEAYGAWLESRVLGKNDCYCFSGGYGESGGGKEDPMAKMRFEKFRERLKSVLVKGNDRRLSQIWKLQYSEMTTEDMLKSWAVVDLMHSQGPDKFAAFLRLMKTYWPRAIRYEYFDEKGEAQEKAIKEAFGWSLEDLEAQVKRHVPKIS
jgi:hypothetical protein